MTLINDLVSIENFVRGVFPTAHIEKQADIRKPAADTFIIRLLSDSRELETAAHYRIDRTYQIVYVGDNAQTVLATMDALSKAFYQRCVVPINGSLRYIRVESVSFSQPFTTDNELTACIGVVSTQIREARDHPTYQKIMHVYERRA